MTANGWQVVLWSLALLVVFGCNRVDEAPKETAPAASDAIPPKPAEPNASTESLQRRERSIKRLRADLLALQPNMDIRVHVVAPETRRERVFEQLGDLCELPHLQHLADSIVDEYADNADESP